MLDEMDPQEDRSQGAPRPQSCSAFPACGVPHLSEGAVAGDEGLSSSAFSSVRGGCCLLELVLACSYNVVKSDESYGGCPWHRCLLIQVSPA